MLIIPFKTTNCLINKQPDLIQVCDTCSCELVCCISTWLTAVGEFYWSIVYNFIAG